MFKTSPAASDDPPRGAGPRASGEDSNRLSRGSAWLLLPLLALTACGAVQIEAPPGTAVRFLDADAPASVRDERVIWYALWGGKPLSDVSTAETIRRRGLREVRVGTELTPWDTVVNAFTSLVSIVRRTVVVEGNP